MASKEYCVSQALRYCTTFLVAALPLFQRRNHIPRTKLPRDSDGHTITYYNNFLMEVTHYVKGVVSCLGGGGSNRKAGKLIVHDLGASYKPRIMH